MRKSWIESKKKERKKVCERSKYAINKARKINNEFSVYSAIIVKFILFFCVFSSSSSLFYFLIFF